MAGLRCVITGVSSGIGDQVARALLDAGAEVTGLDMKKPTAPVSHFVECDLADQAGIDHALSELGSGWQVLCNIAGVPGTCTAEQVLRVNFFGLRYLTEGLLAGMNDGASIVNIASVAAVQWRSRLPQIKTVLEINDEAALQWYSTHAPDCSPYTFSKELVIGYTTVLAQRMWVRHIRVNAVSPGVTVTPMLPELEKAVGKEKLDRIESVVGRHARPEDIAPAAIFLASPNAGWITGQNLVVDAGYLSGARVRNSTRDD
jgi:NAD(P)-dependent dehydrogenase (short-subunit alcohol dehydrogenase family)